MVENYWSEGYKPGSPEKEVGYINSNPNEPLGLEISPVGVTWSFTPEYYPERFTQNKSRKLRRYNGECNGENVSIKETKNREIHISGLLLEGELNIFHALLDVDDVVDIFSPLTPEGGLECYVKKGELAEQKGYNPQHEQWMFNYSLDLVSTGRDEYNRDEKNAIVSAIFDEAESQ